MDNIWQFDLRRGNSQDPRQGACLLDAVSWFEYGTLGDHPTCVCETLAAPGRVINDFLPDDRRQELKILIPRLVGTAGDGLAQARAEFWAWQAIRVFAPLALDASGFHREADYLRSFGGTLEQAAAEALAWAAAKAAAEAAAGAAALVAKAAAEAAAALVAAALVAEASAGVYDASISAMVTACEIRGALEMAPDRMVIANASFASARGVAKLLDLVK
ncbi:MAG TPA: hypothetical protein VGR84_18775 [Candidatus Acidoferrales bacterium]|nr:hypothetical protein [Candidatus Acidoferrales bacterium]